MWLSRKLSQHEMQDVASAQDGTVTVEGGELAVFSSGEKREVKTAAPGGYELSLIHISEPTRRS